ncbi:ATP synthase subunit B [Sorangium cellulosum]|uniref:ATP synthase subunit b n=1 Tax=Sorangium cellulosum TaxID=56 RepID=A0A4P2QE03_SORCE|nr:ATP synthase F0 subunit B [Sorangium cellulosum]AUX27929.1 ATP synthase subunit B [Sorangium cellulosum]
MKPTRRTSLALGLAAALTAGTALAQQPEAQPAMPPGHPPVGAAQPAPHGAARPNPHQMPPRSREVQPGRPIGPGGRQLPPGHGGLRMQAQPGQPGAHGRAAPEAESAAHGHEEHCPGHGPTDPPPHVNWWQGLIGVNNEAAGKGGIHSLLWRYHNEQNPCDPRNQPPPFLASLLNFGLLAFIIVRFGRKPIAEALKKRKQTIMAELDNASRLKEEAEKRLDQYEDKLTRLEETLAELKAEHAAQAEREKAHVLAEAEQRRVRMRKDAEFRIEQELKEARALLLKEAVEGAVAAAEQLLRQRVGKEDHDRVAEEYLKAIPAAVSSGAARGPQTTGAAR